MKVRKLDSGDCRGHIFTVEDFDIWSTSSIKNGKLETVIKPYLKLFNQSPGIGGDDAQLFEVMHRLEEHTDWDDPRYTDWIKIHGHSPHCKECGLIGSIFRSGGNVYTKNF